MSRRSWVFLLFFIFLHPSIFSQDTGSYADSIQAYVSNYIRTHEVVKAKDRKFIRFYAPDETFRVTAKFEKINNSPWFKMDASGPIKKNYRIYGKAVFSIHDTTVVLQIYQSQELMDDPEYRELLFIPFTDATSGTETYTGGRYIDLYTSDIKNHQLVIDFNKAYNPYCAYASGKYNCPVPPKENNLVVAITAGEKKFEGGH